MSEHACRLVDILLVEDNTSDVYLIEEALLNCAAPYRLRTAQNVAQALRLVRCEGEYQGDSCPDLIILDIQLVKERGIDLLKIIKQDDKLKVIPVIVMSSSKAESDIRASYEFHANCYITKPILFHELEQIVSRLMSFWFETAILIKPDV